MKPHIDLNCDLGEHEAPEQTELLMQSISSANIACGGHAGDDDSMERCIFLALEHRVNIGAHPGMAQGFGRSAAIPSPTEFLTLIDSQIRRLHSLLPENVRLHHVKLHGSLYHATDQHRELAEIYTDYMRQQFPDVIIVVRANGLTASVAQQKQVLLWQELFLDRAYQADGSLVPRDLPNACIDEENLICERIDQWCTRGTITATNGIELPLCGQTFCLHGDGPHAASFARLAKARLLANVLV